MAYTAKSLEDIAAAFDHRAWQAAAFSDRLHKTQRDKLLAERERRTWEQAAQMLRETALERPALDTTETSLYFHTMGRAVKVVALADTDNAANAHMTETPGASVIHCHGGLVIMADKSDEGRKL